MLSLVVKHVDGARLVFPVPEQGTLAIGRARDNDVVLDDSSVSRHHAELVLEGDEGWILHDRGSFNGTYVDGEKIAPNESVVLSPGQRVRVGRYDLRLTSSFASGEFVSVSEHPSTPADAVVVSADEALQEPAELKDMTTPLVSLPVVKRRLHRLLIIKQASLELLGFEPLHVLYDKVLDLVTRAVRPERAALLVEHPDKGLVCEAFRGDSAEGSMPVSHSLARRVMDEQVCILIPRVKIEMGHDGLDSLERKGICTAMAAPLRGVHQPLGLIYADSGVPEAFDEEDLRVLTVLANIAAMRVENTRLMDEERVLIRHDQELQAAADVQRRLLPRVAEPIPGYAVDGFNLPCYEVGGDFYDYFSLDSTRSGIVLGDVAGKGLPAAMLLMGVQAFTRAYLALRPEASGLASFLNNGILRYAPNNRFVSLFFVELDHSAHRMQWCNAGHAPAPVIVRRSGRTERLQPGGQPLGILPDPVYAVHECELDEGDLVVICSDGVTDTANPEGEPFTDDRLDRLLRSVAGRTPQQVRHSVLEAVKDHARGAPQTDDLTVVAIQRNFFT